MELIVKVTALLFLTGISCQLQPYQVIHGWKQLDFNFKTPAQREKAILNGDFIPENNALAGIKMFENRIYLSVPRWKLGVPSTLNYIKFNESRIGGSLAGPLLEPFPSWEMQKIGNCSAFQYVHSMEIDEFGRMWVIDTGRVNTLAEDSTEHQNFCAAKIVVIDLKNNEIVKKYEFPSEVVSQLYNLLNDVTVGCSDGNQTSCWAYISDSNQGKIVVYSLEQNRSWFVRHNSSMDVVPGTNPIPILGKNYTIGSRVDGIVLSPKDLEHDRVFYSPLSSYSTYSVPTSVLQAAYSENGTILKDEDVTVVKAKRSSQADGISMDSEGRLIYGVLKNNSVAYINIGDSSEWETEVEIFKNDEVLQWPNSFGFDGKGYLYTISVRLHKFFDNSLDWSDINFRIVRSYLGSRSYHYPSMNMQRILKKMEETSKMTTPASSPAPATTTPRAPTTPKVAPPSPEVLAVSLKQSLSESEKILQNLWDKNNQNNAEINQVPGTAGNAATTKGDEITNFLNPFAFIFNDFFQLPRLMFY